MKIAFLSLYSGLIERGVETLIPEIAERLGKNHEVVVFQGGKSESKNFKIVQVKTNWTPNILQQPFNIKRRLFLDENSISVLKFTLKVLPYLKKEKFDIVIPWNNGWQIILCKLNGISGVIAVGQSGPGWDDRIALWTFPKYFVGFTKAQCEWAQRINPFVKTKIIPNGVDLNRFIYNGAKLKIDLPRPIILCVGALVEVKRQDLAIKAVSKLKKGSLVLVGRGELKDKLQKLGDEFLPKRFKILELPFKDVDKIYRSADIFTFPTSPWESFGLVLLEAMASNLPIVTTDDPIRREIISDTGLFVNPEDTEQYSSTLENALNIKWHNKPRLQAEKFSWDNIVKKYEDLFKEIVK